MKIPKQTAEVYLNIEANPKTVMHIPKQTAEPCNENPGVSRGTVFKS